MRITSNAPSSFSGSCVPQAAVAVTRQASASHLAGAPKYSRAGFDLNISSTRRQARSIRSADAIGINGWVAEKLDAQRDSSWCPARCSGRPHVGRRMAVVTGSESSDAGSR
jgi:hypothetical protein